MVQFKRKCLVSDLKRPNSIHSHMLQPYMQAYTIFSIGPTRPIPPNQRSCLGCIWWKDMSNPKRLRYMYIIVLTENYKSRSAITNLSLLENKHYSSLFQSIIFYSYLNILNNTQSDLLGQFRLTGDRAKYSMYIAFNTQVVTSPCEK